MIKTFIACLVMFAFTGAGSALAEEATPLTVDEAARFVATLAAADALGAELRADGKAEALNVETRPKAGEEFRPYSHAIATLKSDYPADHARLAAIVEPQGFTPETWASVGDKVIIAYLAEKLEKENPGALEQMQAMDASTMQMMPKHVQDQMAAMLALSNAIRKASAEDREAVRPVMADIDDFMDRQDKS